MNTQESTITEIKSKLADSDNGKAMAAQLEQLKQLQSNLAKIGVTPDDSEPPLRIPYSSMPTLRSDCWE